MNTKHILYAEDDAYDLQLTLAALQEINLASQVFVVRDGAEALDYLYCRGKFETRRSGNPAAMLLDLKMPKVNGIEVLKIVKGDDRLKAIPIVVLTSSREVSDVAGCYQHGVNSYVVKPVYFTEFMKTIRQLGVFWAVVNEPPPDSWKEAALGDRLEALSSGKKETKNEIPAQHPASGR